MAVTASAPMLVLARPDDLQATPSALAYTPRSVPATTIESANPKARTERPSRPLTGPDFVGLKAIVRIGALPLRATFHVDPPSVLLISAPSDLPAITTWLLDGL